MVARCCFVAPGGLIQHPFFRSAGDLAQLHCAVPIPRKEVKGDMTLQAESPSSEATTSAPSVRPGPVVGLLVASTFVVVLNETIMGVALPRLMADLQITAGTAQWLTTGFLLTMAVVIPISGYLVARFPLRKLFTAAMTLFALGTLLAALAPGFEVLLAGRIVQAGGTAVMIPLLMTTVLTIVPVTHRGRMMGVISVVIAVAPAIGPTVAGLILSALNWRWMFWLVLPLAVLSLVLGAVWLRNVIETRPAKFDVLSVVLSALGFGGLIFGLSSIGEAVSGHAPVAPWVPIVVGALSLVGFVIRQLVLQRTDSALLDLRTFRSRQFSIAIILVVVVMAALFGSLILLPLYMQQVLGLDTLAVGLVLLPGGLLMGSSPPSSDPCSTGSGLPRS